MRSMTVFNFLLEATLWGSALILLLVAARALLRTRLGNRAVYVAWLLVAMRLLMPIALPNPVMNEFRPGYSTDVEARPIADQVRTRFIDACYDVSNLFTSAHTTRGWRTPLTDLGAETSYGHTGRWVLASYAGVCVLVAGWMIARNIRFRRRIWRDRVSSLEGDGLIRYHRLCVRYKARPVPVYFVDPLHSACLVGAFRPFIAIPLGTPPEHLELTLSHEICHQKAFDGFWGLVRDVCCVVHWFNPLVWMAAQLSRTDCELACDDRVTARLPDKDRLAYADTLVSAASRDRTGLCVLATGMTLTGKRLKKRINAIIHNARVKRWAVAAASLAGACVLVMSFATSESYALPEIESIPEVTWKAALTEISGEEEAVAYTRRFLESEFIGYDTESMDFTAIRDNESWRVYATGGGHALPLTLRFDEGGEVLEFNGLRVVGDISAAGLSYTHRTPTGSLNEYLDAFGRALLPEVSELFAQTVTDDVRLNDMRYVITWLLDDFGRLLHQEVVQVEPVTRVLYYRSGTYANGTEAVRDTLDAQRAVLLELSEVDSFSARCIDSGSFECAWDEEKRAWRVTFTIPRVWVTGGADETLTAALGDVAAGAACSRSWLVNASGEVVERGAWTARETGLAT